MKITDKGYTLDLSREDLDIWMQSLFIAAENTSRLRKPPAIRDDCVYYLQNKKLHELTGHRYESQQTLDKMRRGW